VFNIITQKQYFIMHCPLTWKHMILLLLRSWDDNGQEGHSLVWAMKSVSTLKGLWFLSYVGVKYIGRDFTHEYYILTILVWKHCDWCSQINNIIYKLLRFTCIIVHIHVLKCLVWNRATIFGPSQKVHVNRHILLLQNIHTPPMNATLIALEVLLLADTFL